nr:MAG TPA: hypothetical protein [Caudoviricetes sp.]
MILSKAVRNGKPPCGFCVVVHSDAPSSRGTARLSAASLCISPLPG